MKNKIVNTLPVLLLMLALCVAAYPAGNIAGEDSAATVTAAEAVHEQQAVWAEIPRMEISYREIWEELQASGELDESPDEEDEVSEYANLAIAQVRGYVNVRSEPNTRSNIVGKIYNGAVAEIQCVAGEDKDWFQIVSGSVEGYIKAEYFIYGDDAADVAEEYVTRYSVVKADRLNVRSQPDIEAKRVGYVVKGERLNLIEDCGEWLRVRYTDEREGYVSAEYVTVVEEFTYAKSIEEERAEQAALRALAARENAAEQDTPEIVTNFTPPDVTYTSNEELRRSIIEYALQFVGGRYVMGGNSLTRGTDCSGFTSLIYADFGYSLSRTPSGQLSSAGRSIDYSEIQPGDIICYSTNGGRSCTHVGIYIGDGQIVHAANPQRGIIVSKVQIHPIVGIKNVID